MRLRLAGDGPLGQVPEDRLKELFKHEIFPHLEYLFHYALHLTGMREEANDLLQETMMKAYTHLHTFVPGTNGRAWAYRIMRNTFINNHRKGQRTPDVIELKEDQVAEVSSLNHHGRSTDTNERIDRGTMGDDVAEALESLPEKIKNVLLLRDIEDLPYEEIAEALNIPVGTVRSRLHRARSILFARLKAYALSKGYSVNDIGIAGDVVLAT